jgi:hypothetical protein
MNRFFTSLATLAAAAPLLAHVTPNVQLVRKGEFVRVSLPAAVKFFEKKLDIGGPDLAAIREATGWTPSEEDARLYVGRDADGKLVGSAAFVWVPSEHGPVGVGVAFDPAGRILRAAVTDVGSEPLAWVRPLIAAGAMKAFEGRPVGSVPRAGDLAPDVRISLSRYYAGVIVDGVRRAQALERVALELESARGNPAEGG